MGNGTFSMADTYGRGVKDRQAEAVNKLAIDAGQYKFDQQQQLDNTKWQAAMGQHGLTLDPSEYPAYMEKVEAIGKQRGMWEQIGDGSFDYRDPANVEKVREGFQNMYDEGMAGLKGFAGPAPTDLSAQDTPYSQRLFDGTVKKVGATPAGATSNERDFARLQEIEAVYGRDSPQYKQFAAQLVRPYYGDIAQVPTRVTATGQEPLSSLPVEADAANTVKMAEGEGGRGRSMQPDGSYAATPGTQAAIDEAAERRKRIKGARMTSIQAQTVLEDTTRLNDQLDAGTVPLGKAAAIQERLDPLLQSQDYRNAVSLIKSVEGNVGIDSLLRIKASGAGLGQVPQTQLDMLSRLLGELDLKQDPAQFRRTWNRMNQIYTEIMEISDAELAELETERPDIFTPEGGVENQAYMLRQARQAIMEGRSSRAAVIQKLQELGIDPGLL